MKYLLAALIFAGVSLAAKPYLSHGNVQYLNDGTATDITLGRRNGNGISVWCPATSQWQMFEVPPPVPITNIAAGPSGGIRVTHAATSRPFVTGQWITISKVVGTTEVNVHTAPGAKRITVVSPTEMDLDDSVFQHAYAGSGQIDGVVVARVDNITIDGVPDRDMPANLRAHLAGLRYLDADCTVGEIVLDSVTAGPGQDYVNPNLDPETGFNVLPSYSKVILIGMSARDPILGIQGNAGSELGLSWFHATPFTAFTSYQGSTAGAVQAWVPLTPAMHGNPQPRLLFLLWRGQSPVIHCLLHVTSTAPADMMVRITFGSVASTAASYTAFHHDGNGMQQVVATIPVAPPQTFDGLWTVDLELFTTAGVATVINTGAPVSLCQVVTYY